MASGEVMTHYACSDPCCPVRAPVEADEPPTCYTCGAPMAVRPLDEVHAWALDLIMTPERQAESERISTAIAGLQKQMWESLMIPWPTRTKQ